MDPKQLTQPEVEKLRTQETMNYSLVKIGVATPSCANARPPSATSLKSSRTTPCRRAARRPSRRSGLPTCSSTRSNSASASENGRMDYRRFDDDAPQRLREVLRLQGHRLRFVRYPHREDGVAMQKSQFTETQMPGDSIFACPKFVCLFRTSGESGRRRSPGNQFRDRALETVALRPR